MAPSKSTRISILLAIDTVFFLLELTVGFAVHSLALVADAFHMLNDVLSLCVGLWAVKVANSKSNSKTYTYGWQRAETLGALLNAVFLIALCVSIFLEAIQRLVDPPEVTQPVLILVVGCAGLASNLVGLLLFHDHGHSHGPGGHSHEHGIRDAEEGHAHTEHEERERQAADESGNVADVLPQNRIGGWPQSKISIVDSNETAVNGDEPSHIKSNASHARNRKHSRSGSKAYSSIDDIHINPASFRKSIIDASRFDEYDPEADAVRDDNDDTHVHASDAPLLNSASGRSYGSITAKKVDHSKHIHSKPREAVGGGGHGHSHADLNMKGVFLHVMGDALGNIGVIATALFIWLSDVSWRFYADPIISLVITAIILASAIPLCKAASRILLQAVPAGISVDDIKEDIETLPGILSCHHLHVWQLSDTKLIASLHVRVAMDFKNEDAGRYMELARDIRRCFHDYGIHSVTIQPEFCMDEEHDHSQAINGHRDHDGHAHGAEAASKTASNAGSVCEPETCLLECDEDCGPNSSCCGPAKSDAGDDAHAHDHGSTGHGHTH